MTMRNCGCVKMPVMVASGGEGGRAGRRAGSHRFQTGGQITVRSGRGNRHWRSWLPGKMPEGLAVVGVAW